MSLYSELVAAGCRIDNHESDLYVERTATALAILRKPEHEQARKNATAFVHAVEGTVWIDVPFLFDPFWERLAKREA